MLPTKDYCKEAKLSFNIFFIIIIKINGHLLVNIFIFLRYKNVCNIKMKDCDKFLIIYDLILLRLDLDLD